MKLTGFDFFDVQPAVEPDPMDEAKRRLELGFGSPARHVAAGTYVRPRGMAAGVADLALLWPNQGWALISDAQTKAEAEAIGRKAQTHLTPPSKLTAADPYVHTLPLFVIYGRRWVKLEAPQKKRTGPKPASVTEVKAALAREGNAVFGAGAVSITGKAGAYQLRIEPRKVALRRAFRPVTVSGDLDKLESKLREAIKTAQAFLRR